MAGPYYVDDGGDGTTENSWATADTSINDLDAEYTFASDEIVYFGHDSNCQATNAANLTITGPTSGAPVKFISATQGSDPVTYAQSTSTAGQIDTSEGAYSLTFDGSFALYGMTLKSGYGINLSGDGDEVSFAQDTTFKLAANGQLSGTTSGRIRLIDCVIDLSADGTTNRANDVFYVNSSSISMELTGLTFVNAAYRTGQVCRTNAGAGGLGFRVSGCDFSGFTNATACELLGEGGGANSVFTNCLTAATWVPFNTQYPANSATQWFVNCGPADAPTYLAFRSFWGDIVSSSSIYRTGGATVEGDACSWLVTTRATYANESTPFYSPWILGTVSSTGSKTFDVYISNDSADFTDAEVWLEVEYLGTADEAQSALATDQRADILATAAAQTDDVTSTWNGTGPSFTYKQKLSATATVNETGAYRARVAVGVANIASSRYFYIDPKVTVS